MVKCSEDLNFKGTLSQTVNGKHPRLSNQVAINGLNFMLGLRQICLMIGKHKPNLVLILKI